MDWTAVGAIAIVLQTVLLGVGLVLGLRQARAAVAARQLQGIHRIHDELAATRADREWFFNDLPSDPADVSDSDWARLSSLLATFDRIAVLCEDGIVDEKLLLRSHDSVLARLWIAAAPYVEWRRRGRPGHLEHFERLSLRAIQGLPTDRKQHLDQWIELRHQTSTLDGGSDDATSIGDRASPGQNDAAASEAARRSASGEA